MRLKSAQVWRETVKNSQTVLRRNSPKYRDLRRTLGAEAAPPVASSVWDKVEWVVSETPSGIEHIAQTRLTWINLPYISTCAVVSDVSGKIRTQRGPLVAAGSWTVSSHLLKCPLWRFWTFWKKFWRSKIGTHFKLVELITNPLKMDLCGFLLNFLNWIFERLVTKSFFQHQREWPLWQFSSKTVFIFIVTQTWMNINERAKLNSSKMWVTGIIKTFFGNCGLAA